MIQRIQTLYLLILTALMAVTIFAPLAWFAGEIGEFRLYSFSLQSLDGSVSQSTAYMGILLVLACLLPLVTIFLYRRRLLQIRLCVVEMVLLIGATVMEGIYYFLSSRIFSDMAFHTQGFKPAIALPLVGLLFAFLAAVPSSTTSCWCATPTGSADPLPAGDGSRRFLRPRHRLR